MCTVVVLIRPGHPWPVLIAANRDERLDRAWDPPAGHWPDRPGTIGGRDRLGGGTWMAMRRGVCAAVLNRVGSLGPAPGKRSRGDLPLEAVAGRLPSEGSVYRTFNLVVADREGARLVRNAEDGLATRVLPPGLHVVTARDPDDPANARAGWYADRFAGALPEPPDWTGWAALLADRTGPDPINVGPRDGFGTVCASLVGLPAAGQPVWLFAGGPPDRAPFAPAMGAPAVANPAPPCYTAPVRDRSGPRVG